MLKIKIHTILVLLFTCFFTVESTGQEINQFDKNQQRTGVWKKYYPNNQLRYSGQFLHGKEVGVFQFYDENAPRHPVIVKKYKENAAIAAVSFYTVAGVLRSKGAMLQKKRIGRWLYFFSDGSLLSEENYVAGKKEGVQVNYFKNGQVTSKVAFKNNVKEGLSEIYSDQGVLIESVRYANGVLNGAASYYDLKGSLKERGVYANGSRQGKWQYYLNGALVSKKKVAKSAKI